MAKKLGKSEKLDLILSELRSLRSDVKTLLKQERQAAGKSREARRPQPQPAKKAAAKGTRSRTPAKPRRPVLVEAAESDAPAANLTSRIA